MFNCILYIRYYIWIGNNIITIIEFNFCAAVIHCLLKEKHFNSVILVKCIIPGIYIYTYMIFVYNIKEKLVLLLLFFIIVMIDGKEKNIG